MLAANPGSVCEIDMKAEVNKKGETMYFFNRLFLAFKPCMDGFLGGCRPYLEVDLTFLTGKYTGQLAAATAVDGHSWMFPVAFGHFDKENTENWVWFMQQLKLCIGEPEGLAIHTDACKGLENAIKKVYPNCEHRECMVHLMLNFKKKFKGAILDNMWPAGWTYEVEKHESLMEEIDVASPTAIAYLKEYHNRLWTRSKFSPICKVEYAKDVGLLAICKRYAKKRRYPTMLIEMQLLHQNGKIRRTLQRQLFLPHQLQVQ